MSSKRYREIRSKIEQGSLIIQEALEKIKETATAKFDESVEISIVLGVDPVKSDQMVRGSVVLPNGTGKEVSVAVICQDDKLAEAAKNAGAVLAGKDNILDEIKKGILNFDVLIASPECMKDLGRYGKTLGPKGLMPSPKSGTVTPDVVNAVERVKQGQVEFKMDKNGVLHGILGKVSCPTEKLVENYDHYVETVKKSRPSSAKGRFIKKVSLASTMGPSVEVIA
jgi:large subunit ribosomal protein L1